MGRFELKPDFHKSGLYMGRKIFDNETGLKGLSMEDVFNAYDELAEENQRLKQRLAEKDDIKWLRENTVWEIMPSNRRTYTTTEVKK